MNNLYQNQPVSERIKLIIIFKSLKKKINKKRTEYIEFGFAFKLRIRTRRSSRCGDRQRSHKMDGIWPYRKFQYLCVCPSNHRIFDLRIHVVNLYHWSVNADCNVPRSIRVRYYDRRKERRLMHLHFRCSGKFLWCLAR